MPERPEIISGLRNALDRGYSLEIAISSFINAGYNAQDVKDSAKVLGGSFLNNTQTTPIPTAKPQVQSQQFSQPPHTPQSSPSNQARPSPVQQQTPIQQPVSQSPRPPQAQQPRQFPAQTAPPVQSFPQPTQPFIPSSHKRHTGLIIFLVLLLVVLLGALFTIIFARQFVIDILSKIGLSI